MGYELVYFYREKLENNEYSEEVKEKKVKVGDPWEDIPLENVAGKIMSQLARRNILITDIEIYRFQKEKISYRETDDGIVIKNRKFKFDDGPALESVEVPTAQAITPPVPPPLPIKGQAKGSPGVKGPGPGATGETIPPSAQINLAAPVKRPLRWEVFDASYPILKEKAKVGKFTMGKKYPIYEVLSKGNVPFTTSYYKTIDDRNQEVEIVAECFNAVSDPVLDYSNTVDSYKDPGIPLSYGNSVSDDMINIRGK
jgi:hypothetical protein